VIAERPGLERRILDSIEAGRTPVLLGGCGVGRTSLLLRLEGLLGRERSQYIDMAASTTTPERCLTAIGRVSRFGAVNGAERLTSPKASMEALFQHFDAARSASGEAATWLLDEVLDVRTFESFPGLRHVQRDLVTHLSRSPARFVLASRFTARAHRLLRDAPPRFEVIHVPPLDVSEVRGMALLIDSRRPAWAADVAPPVASLARGRASAVRLLLETLAAMGPAIDPVAALASLFSARGQLTARCRESYELRLHRARGYGALKAILGILSEDEPRNLTEIAQRLQRTPGSTKDYLSWLEDVDLVRVQGKRYAFEDSLLRLYVRLYGRPVPPTDDDVVREIAAYARAALPQDRSPADSVAAGSGSGIIEID
jgi:hypothetical protein